MFYAYVQSDLGVPVYILSGFSLNKERSETCLVQVHCRNIRPATDLMSVTEKVTGFIHTSSLN